MKQFGLSKKERIKAKKDFAIVYSSGKTITSCSQKLKAIFFVQPTSESGIKAAFVVYKKAGSAVWRNRIKRLLRESYRLNKNILSDIVQKNESSLLLVLAAKSINQKTNKKINLNDILPDVVDLLEQIKRRL